MNNRDTVAQETPPTGAPPIVAFLASPQYFDVLPTVSALGQMRVRPGRAIETIRSSTTRLPRYTDPAAGLIALGYSYGIGGQRQLENNEPTTAMESSIALPARARRRNTYPRRSARRCRRRDGRCNDLSLVHSVRFYDTVAQVKKMVMPNGLQRARGRSIKVKKVSRLS